MGAVCDRATVAVPSRRHHARVKMPIEVEIGDEAYYSHDWSLGGFCLPGDTCWAERDVPVRLLIPYGRLRFTFEIMARSVFHDVVADITGFQFINLTDGQRDMMRALIIALVAGPESDLEELLSMPDNAEALTHAGRDGGADGNGLGYSVTAVVDEPAS